MPTGVVELLRDSGLYTEVILPTNANVGDVMTTNVITVPVDTKLICACKLMTDNQISSVVVIDPENPQRAIGIITERRVVNYLTIHPLDTIESTNVSGLIDSQLYTLGLNEPLIEAIKLCQQNRIRHVIVVDDQQRLQGVVSFTDVIEQVIAESNQNVALLDSSDSNSNDSVAEVMRRLAFTDPMTGVGNRRALDLDLEHQWEIAQRYHRQMSLAMVDVDFFKRYNDHYGHLDGDEALKSIVEVINNSTRASDKVFRFGGEEFCILLPETAVEDALALVKRIIKAIEEKAIPHEKAPNGVVTISGGVSGISLSHVDSVADMLESADRALYRAKTEGKNRASLSEPLRKAG